MTDMAGYRRQNADGPNSEEKALDLFAEMMIEKIESINEDWRKPWFTEGALQWPRNLSGREYNGMNAFMLMLHCEKEGYKIPRFCTFDCVQRMNKPGKDGQELPRVSVLRGEKSFPVMLTTFTCIHKETKEKIKYDDYKNLSEDEKKEYNVYLLSGRSAASLPIPASPIPVTHMDNVSMTARRLQNLFSLNFSHRLIFSANARIPPTIAPPTCA